MLSFKVITEENKEEVLNVFENEIDREVFPMLLDIISSFSDDEDIEFAIAVSSGCVIVRVFDMGKYVFLYPYEILDGADTVAAISEVSNYAMREEIPLIFSDVPREALSTMGVFRHMDIDAEDKSGDMFRVKVKTECMLIDEIPEIDGDRVKLSALEEADIPLYAELCKSQNVNKYWGYNYSDDVSSPTDEYFYENAISEFKRGVAMSLAIRSGDEFCGEAVLYAFDGMGGVEFAIRLLPEKQGKGLGRITVAALIKLGMELGLERLCSVIMKENVKSLAMLDSMSTFVRNVYIEDQGSSFRYTFEI